ncbi:hypothetical protein FE782_19000 [Paenibacillus antri]|uniref:Uncharacterized protein n=1 Tax=Paenibacillus antri TaxID=2582848 RepID=A0A5R9G8U3_9BACL|nr:hypothetical protein [Paenibacillus antri]TLS50786.1 hypothetical protein FE782_19000 [Paenibacillus antri]
MKRRKSYSWLVPLVGAFLIAAIAAAVWFQRSEPLIDNGLTIYEDPDGNGKVYTLEIVNGSNSDIDIQSVTVNGGTVPDRIQLGITYDSNRLVQFLGEQTDPATTLMGLHDASIQPQLSAEEIRTIVARKTNSEKRTPIHYGLVVRYDQGAVQEMTIRYTYLGFAKVKRITQWFE